MPTPREKWQAYLAGDDTGPMVAPLVDDWCLDQPYAWPYDEPDPYPPGHPHHALSQQMAMAELGGYDPLFLVAPPFVQTSPLQIEISEIPLIGRTRREVRTQTPLGELLAVFEVARTEHLLRGEVQSADDLRRERWAAEQERGIDDIASFTRGQALLAPARDKGMIGAWWGPPMGRGIPREDLFYLMEDYPELVCELMDLQFQTQLERLPLMRMMGYDYLFYCVDGTEWISPTFFEVHVAPYIRLTFARWRELGGFIVWHSCGHVATFIEQGYYNEFLPEIFETMSEPPYGNLPSLRWGRERLDPRIATKGNVDLKLLHDGSELDIRVAVRRVREQTAGYRHIVGASDDILAGTPLAHLQAFVDEARRG